MLFNTMIFGISLAKEGLLSDILLLWVSVLCDALLWPAFGVDYLD